MSKVKFLSIGFLLFVGVLSASAQIYKYKGYQVAYKYAENGKWTDWTDWFNSDDSIIFDFDYGRFIIDTAVLDPEERTKMSLMIYDENIIKFSPSSGVKDYQYSVFWLNNVKFGTARIHYDKNGNLQFYLSFTEDKIDFVWNIKLNDLEVSQNVETIKNGCRFTVNGVSFTMISVEGGTFMMGATSGQEKPEWNEEPAHKVTLSGFYIGETEVTQALWTAVMGKKDTWYKGDDLPVESVSWDECQEFVGKLNMATEGKRPAGRKFRLPTEAEWEFAARGGNKSNNTLFAGSNDIEAVAWWNDNYSHPVAQKQCNELGLYDMTGNVCEWCQDGYASDYYKKSPSSNPYNDYGKYGFRVFRGGSLFHYKKDCRVSSRHGIAHDNTRNFIGLRLAL